MNRKITEIEHHVNERHMITEFHVIADYVTWLMHNYRFVKVTLETFFIDLRHQQLGCPWIQSLMQWFLDEHPLTVPPSMNDLYNETITFTTVDYAEIFNYLNSDDNSSSLYEDSYSDDTSQPDVDIWTNDDPFAFKLYC